MLRKTTVLRFTTTLLLAGAIATAVGGCLLVPFPAFPDGGHHGRHHGYRRW